MEKRAEFKNRRVGYVDSDNDRNSGFDQEDKMTEQEITKITMDVIAMSHEVEPEGYFRWKTKGEYRAFNHGVGAMAEKLFEYFSTLEVTSEKGAGQKSE